MSGLTPDLSGAFSPVIAFPTGEEIELVPIYRGMRGMPGEKGDVGDPADIGEMPDLALLFANQLI